MSRFIPEGKSDMKSLQAKEKMASRQFQEEQEDKDKLSLFEQMRLNHLAKEQEYEDKVKAKNQSHKISQRELDHYNKLQRRKHDEELAKKREIEEGLREFDEKRKKQKTLEVTPDNVVSIEPLHSTKKKQSKPSLGISKKRQEGITKPIKTQAEKPREAPKELEQLKVTEKNPKPLLSGYDSDSDSE